MAAKHKPKENKARLCVSRQNWDEFVDMLTIYDDDLELIGSYEVKPFMIPRRFFGQSGAVIIPMRMGLNSDASASCIMIKQSNFDELKSWFEVFDGERKGPALRKVFDFPAEHTGLDKSFKLVAYVKPEQVIDEPKRKEIKTKYEIEI